MNNIMGAFGFTTMVCGDQAVYTAAALEQRGWDARVVNGERGLLGMTSTHSWIEVKVDGKWVEADPWARATIPSDNAKQYKITGTWDVQRGQAEDILQEFRKRSGASSDLEPKMHAQGTEQTTPNIVAQDQQQQKMQMLTQGMGDIFAQLRQSGVVMLGEGQGVSSPTSGFNQEMMANKGMARG